MAFPFTRDTSFAGSVPITNAFLNTLQDGVIGVAAAKALFTRRFAVRDDGAGYEVRPLYDALTPTASGMTIALAAGSLVVKTSDGTIKAYELAAPLTQVINAAHGTLDRYDLIGVKVSDLGVLSQVYVPGTAAASPVNPTMTAGYTTVARIKVAAAVVSIAGSAVSDHRRPFGYQRHLIDTSQMQAASSGGWTLVGGVWQGAAGGPHILRVPLPFVAETDLEPHLLLARIKLACKLDTSPSGAVALKGNRSLSTGASSAVTLSTLTTLITDNVEGTYTLTVLDTDGYDVVWAGSNRSPLADTSDDGRCYLDVSSATATDRVYQASVEWFGL